MASALPAAVASSAPHLLIVAFPCQGHLIPAVSLARVLASAGFHLTLLSTHHTIANFQHQQLPHIRFVGLPTPPPLGPPKPDRDRLLRWPLRLVEKSHVMSDRDDPLSAPLRLVEKSHVMSVAFEQWVEELLSGSLPDVSIFGPLVAIISDHFCPWTQAVATKLGIPRYVLFKSPAKLLAQLFLFPSLVASGRLLLSSTMEDSILVPGVGSLPLAELSFMFKDSPSQIVFQFFHDNACRLHDAAGVFVNSFQDLEPRAMDTMKVNALNPNAVPIYSIGPFPPHPFCADPNQPASDPPAESTKAIIDWLNSQSHSSVLYIFFETVSRAQIYEIAVGLQSSQLPFLWILRSASTADSANPSAMLSFLPERFEQHSQKHGMIVSSWVPQPLILSHPSVGGFLTHCGWNSTIESICSGVPIIAHPQMPEQQLICRMVVDEWKVGLRLKSESDGVFRGAELERQASKLVTESEEGTSIRERMSELSKAARQAIIEKDGSSASNLQAFVREMTAK